ncbi:MAG: ABC transporter ATP-binding protein [Anaerolineaceae bacterium]|nr:ABC transporter ATP-binding protein [Anaerolineaceae bacterium]
MKKFICLENVNKQYGEEPQIVDALTNINLRIQQGEFIGVIGKSGAGKSTLINLLAGIDKATSGLVQIQGVNLSNMNEEQLTTWRGKNIGVVYQTFQLLNQLTIIDNILLAMDFCGKFKERISAAAAMNILQSLEIKDQAFKKPAQLSGGQKQRAAIARSLANDPPILLADEPTGSLDSQTSKTIFNLFSAIAKQGRTVIVVTHDISKRDLFSRIITLKDGKVINEANK